MRTPRWKVNLNMHDCGVILGNLNPLDPRQRRTYEKVERAYINLRDKISRENLPRDEGTPLLDIIEGN